MRITLCLIIALQLILSLTVHCFAASPLSLANIETLLRSKVSSKRVAQLVEERKAALNLTAASRRKLVELGAQEGLISAIRKNSVAFLQLESTPAGAEVFLNGKYKGKTPVFLERVEPGTYELQVGRLEGYYDFTDQMVLPPGEPAKKSVVLKRRPEQPAAGQVAAKDRDRAEPAPPPHPAKTPPLPADEAKVGPAVHPGAPVDHSGAGPVDHPGARPAAERQLVAVSVGTEPVSAQIYLDGKYIAASPADFLVTVGPHQLRLVPVRNPEYQTLEKEILVRTDALNAHLIRLTSK